MHVTHTMQSVNYTAIRAAVAMYITVEAVADRLAIPLALVQMKDREFYAAEQARRDAARLELLSESGRTTLRLQVAARGFAEVVNNR